MNLKTLRTESVSIGNTNVTDLITIVLYLLKEV